MGGTRRRDSCHFSAVPPRSQISLGGPCNISLLYGTAKKKCSRVINYVKLVFFLRTNKNMKKKSIFFVWEMESCRQRDNEGREKDEELV